MKNNTAKEPITVLGIDLAKQSFLLHGVNAEGKVVLKKKLNRKQITAFVANLPVCHHPHCIPHFGKGSYPVMGAPTSLKSG